MLSGSQKKSVLLCDSISIKFKAEQKSSVPLQVKTVGLSVGWQLGEGTWESQICFLVLVLVTGMLSS
jgi:hypothetical protein